MTEQTAYTSSYFAYNRYSHLHKFYDSAEFNELEKQFVHLSYFDVARLFPSLYTHSISWAIRGKHRTKRQVFQTRSCEKAFDSQFDRLLQQMNYKESHGIPIGPELCRIFAEIILQRVDGEIVARLATNGKVLGKDYRCYRFIDDYFLFHHDVEVRSIFRRALSEELERFGLYLNEAKESMRARPFISAVSAAKLEVSAMLSGLYVRRAMLRASRAYDEVSQLRALTKRSGVSFAEVSGFFMASLDRQVGMALRDVTENLFDILYVQLDLGFHVFRMDTRVATVYKMTAIVLRILKNRDRLRSPDLAKILDKIVFEMNGALQTTLAQGYPLESINILIALAAVSDHYSLAGAELIAMVDQLRRMRDDEYEAPSRLSYWEIVGLLYYCADGVEYGAVRSLLVDEAEKVIRHLDPFEYAESAHLILDLVACPYLDQADKDRLVHRFAAHHTAKPVTADIGHFINFVSSHSWYFNWARGENFWAHLRKKNFKVGY